MLSSLPQRAPAATNAPRRGSQKWLPLRTFLSSARTPAILPSPAVPAHVAFALEHRKMLEPSAASKLTPAAGGGYLQVNILLATLSGCFWFLACPPFDFSLLAWVAMVPAMFAIDRAKSTRGSALLCWW